MKKFLFFRGHECNESEDVISYDEYHRRRDREAEEQYRIRYYEQMKLMEPESENKPIRNKVEKFFDIIFSDKMYDIYDKIWSIVVFGFLGVSIVLYILAHFSII